MGEIISKIVTDNGFVSLGEDTAIDMAKKYYLMLGENGHNVV